MLWCNLCFNTNVFLSCDFFKSVLPRAVQLKSFVKYLQQVSIEFNTYFSVLAVI